MQKATLENLISHEVKVLSNAEAQIPKRLAQVAASVPAGAARDILSEQIKQSESRAGLLKSIVDKVAGGGASLASCVGIRALLDEVERASNAGLPEGALKAEIALGVQRIKEYQLAGYQAVQVYATALGTQQDFKPLEASITADEKTVKKLGEVSHGLGHHDFVQDLLAHESLVLSKAENQVVKSFGPTATLSTSKIRAELQHFAAGAGGASSAASCLGIRALLDEVERAADADLDRDAVEVEVALGTQRTRQYQAAGYNAIQGYATAVGKDVKFIAPVVTASQQATERFGTVLRTLVG